MYTITLRFPTMVLFLNVGYIFLILTSILNLLIATYCYLNTHHLILLLILHPDYIDNFSAFPTGTDFSAADQSNPDFLASLVLKNYYQIYDRQFYVIIYNRRERRLIKSANLATFGVPPSYVNVPYLETSFGREYHYNTLSMSWSIILDILINLHS